MIKNIILIISIFFNLALYNGWMDLGQYKNTVDESITAGKNFVQSNEFQALKEKAINDITTIVNNNMDKETIVKEIKNEVSNTVINNIDTQSAIKTELLKKGFSEIEIEAIVNSIKNNK